MTEAEVRAERVEFIMCANRIDGTLDERLALAERIANFVAARADRDAAKAAVNWAASHESADAMIGEAARIYAFITGEAQASPKRQRRPAKRRK